jgi:predicted dehydrogenase
MNFAICGFGFMGSAHAQCLTGRTDARVEAIVDINLRSVAQGEKGGNLSIPGTEIPLENVSLHTDLEGVLAMPQIDVVDICLPLRFHFPWAKRALEAGKHVLLEKPMVLDPHQGRHLIELARRTGRILMVAHVVRFMPAYRALRSIFEEGSFGPLEFLLLQRWAGEPSWGTWQDPEVRRSSGGGLFDMLIHDIDIANWFLGRPTHIESTLFGGGVSDQDFVNAVWHYEGGGAVVVQGGFAFHHRLPFAAKFLARFARATVAFNSERPGVLTIAGPEKLDSMKLEEDPLDGYRREIEYFIACVRERRWPDLCSPESSLEALELARSHLTQP